MPTLSYQNGFRNYFETEAIEHALIKSQNSPQKVPFDLYAEQISGSAFTEVRHENLFSWLYRIQPSVLHSEFEMLLHNSINGNSFDASFTPPTQMRWDPKPYPTTACHFIEGLMAFAGNGSPQTHQGAVIYLYVANQSMTREYFSNSDGEFLIVPQEGALRIKTELGILEIKPGEIAVIPRGIKFQVEILNDAVRGYLCENFGAPFRLPELGLIGANGLAHARHFETPIAAYEDLSGEFQLITKFQGRLWSAFIDHSPLNVVAWHGNYAPYRYDLSLFNTINTVSYDHLDPSIFTVLTSPSYTQGVANVDFVIFPPRWVVAESTFRPPYFHRNIMSEFMGLINGHYDAKETGFLPGGCSLHNCMSAHGPDFEAYHKATHLNLQPEFYANTLAFMFESKNVWCLTADAYHADFRQKNYLNCWKGLKKQFDKNNKEMFV